MTEISEAIIVLTKTSELLEKFANSKENYNSSYASYIEQMSWEMYKHANDLKEIMYTMGGV